MRWVDDPKPRRVVSVGSGYVEVTGGAGDVNACEPCLPPAPPTTHMRADGAEVPVTNTLNGLVSSTYDNTTEGPKTVVVHGTNDLAKWRTDADADAQSEAIYRQWMESRPRANGAAKAEFKPGPVLHWRMPTEKELGEQIRKALDMVEPAYEPDVPSAISEADGHDYLGMADAADRYYRAHVAGANSTCPKCGGLAYVGLQEAKCLAPRCERVEPEPEVRELWVGFRHEKRPGERGIRDALLAPMGPDYERWWQATGRGVTKNHPIREEAIRLWREAVSRD